MNDVTIIGGGWSVRSVVLDMLCGTVIAVNDSAILAPRWDIAVSMDRLWTEGRIEQLRRRCTETEPPRKAWIRKSALQNIEAQPQDAGFIQPFDCDHESTIFSVIPERLNGSNSGACALNLAWKLRPRRVFLLGFDMNRDPDGRAYWYPPYPWSTGKGSTTDGKYRNWARQFEDAAAAFAAIECQVFNVSPKSAIDTFPKITPVQYARMSR